MIFFKSRRTAALLRKAAPRILLVTGIGGASKIYRCLNLIDILRYCGVSRIRIIDESQLDPVSDLAWSDVVILHRPYVSTTLRKFASRCRKRKKAVVFSSDDLITDHEVEKYLRLDTRFNAEELKEFHRNIDRTVELIEESDYVIVSTEHLRQVMRGLNERILVIENALNEELLEIAGQLNDGHAVLEGEEKVTLGYFSGWPGDHDYDFSLITGPLMHLMEKDPRVHLQITGHLNLDSALWKYENRIVHNEYVDFYDLPARIKQVDVNLIPVEDNPHKNCKSAIKFLEASILQVPSTASRVEPYLGMIRNGQALLCGNEDEWEEALSSLTKDTSARRERALEAYRFVLEHHTTAHRIAGVRNFMQTIREIV